jgi:predicted acyl esterase
MKARVAVKVLGLAFSFTGLLTLSAQSVAGASIHAAVTPWPGGSWRPDPVRYGMTTVHSVSLKMDDGVTLLANVGYPSDISTGNRASGTFPVLLTQDPYSGAAQLPNGYYVTRGYINAVVEVRGTGDTHGPGGSQVASSFFGPRQTKDGVALVQWAAHKLSGSNGVVGLDGCSFLGIDQIFTAAAVGSQSPVKEILPACAANGYDNYFAGGIPSQVAGLFDSPLAQSLDGTNNEPVNNAANDALEHQFVSGGPAAYNGKFWQERTTYNVAPQIVKNGIPALLWSGWYPTDGPGSLIEYSIFQNAYARRPPFGPMKPNQSTTGRYQIVVGPWMHGQGLDDAFQLEWYDTWLKGEHTGITNTSTPMHLYELQAGEWANARTYPLTDDYQAYHLGDGGSLSTSLQGSGSSQILWGQPVAGKTSISFDAPSFRRQVTIGGPIAATIYARSSNRNLELIGTLFDVEPDGKSTQLATGTVLGSLRAVDRTRSWYDKNQLMVLPDHPDADDRYASAGTLQRYDIGLTPTLYSVPAGDHLQFVLTTQAPTSDCASLLSALTAPLPCILSTPQKKTVPGGVYQIVWSRTSPSSLNVPILGSAELTQTASAVTSTSSGETEPIDWGR